MDRNDFERNGPYVIYKNSKHEVLGIWFYEAKESEKIFKFFQKSAGVSRKEFTVFIF